MADIIHKIFGKQHSHHGKHADSTKKDEKEKDSGAAEGYTKQQMDFCE
jgi:hypothetical protein